MPGCIVSATTANFSSVEKRRLRATPVITSTFENVSDIGTCLGLFLGPLGYRPCPVKTGCTPWTAAKQCVQSIFMVAKTVSLAVRKDPEIYDNPVSNAVAKDFVMWTVYDNKVFRDQARAI